MPQVHNAFTDQLGLDWPIVQAPMAGVSTPSLAAAVSNAGGLGSLGVGAMSPDAAKATIRETRTLTNRAININLFCHRPAQADPQVNAAWVERMAPLFASFDAKPPETLREIYASFVGNDDMLGILLEERPNVVSFHFGLPTQAQIDALKNAGIFLAASATSMDEARTIQAAGIDAIVAQGIEAGGHRGVFDPDAPDAQLSTLVLTQILADAMDIPVIAAGGIMTGGGVASALSTGASAAQLGTAFVACPETSADAAYRAALADASEHGSVLTRAFSGRPARGLKNAFTHWANANSDAKIPVYPNAYDAAKALNAAAMAASVTGYGAQWAGQGAPLSRALPAAEMMRILIAELEAAYVLPDQI